MRVTAWRVCPAVVTLVFTLSGAHVSGEPPAPSQSQHPPGAGNTGVEAQQHLSLPDISVKSVWIGSGNVSESFDPLGRNPKVGEMIALGCDIGVSGKIDYLAFKVAWYVDGAKTCGEGTDTVQNPPVCEFTWPLTVGTRVFVDYVPHQAGAHTYMCAVDVGNQVAERNESNNARSVSFTAVGPLTPTAPLVRTPVAKVLLGPKIENH